MSSVQLSAVLVLLSQIFFAAAWHLWERTDLSLNSEEEQYEGSSGVRNHTNCFSKFRHFYTNVSFHFVQAVNVCRAHITEGGREGICLERS